jgi:transcriptional regulator with XRE-family HTH domain
MDSCVNIKHSVYTMSNAAFNTPLNRLFRVSNMKTRPIDRALKRAKDRGLNQSQLAGLLDVDPQHITNWKSRGLPPEWHERMADVLDWSLDELLGRPPTSTLSKDWPFPELDIRRIERLTQGELLQIQGVVLDRLAELELSRQVRNTIKNKSDPILRTVLGSAPKK